MKQLLLFIGVYVATETKAQKTLPAIQSLRYNEEYLFLKDDTVPTVYKKLKYIPLSPNGLTHLSFGGDVRYQYFNIRNEDWGTAPEDENGFLLSRLLVHADLHTDKHIRSFVQLQSSMATNKGSGSSPVDENSLDLHQAFIDIRPAPALLLRVGRQEFSYGSQRLVSVRELPNNRQAFDAAKISLRHQQHQFDLFYSQYVQGKKGLFDDRSGNNIRFWGSYLVAKQVPFIGNADLYYLGLFKRMAVFEEGTGEEERHSVGARLWNEKDSWRYDMEGVFQAGRFNGKRISAWTLSLNTGYRFARARLQPEIGLKTEVISGDRKKRDERLQTFNPLFPRGAYFGLAALIGPSNLVDVHPSLLLQLWAKQLSWSVDYDAFWRYSTNDGIYAPNVSPIFPAGGSSHRFIGQQLASELLFTPNPFLFMRLEATFFRSGSYLKEVGPGKNIFLLGMTTQFRF